MSVCVCGQHPRRNFIAVISCVLLDCGQDSIESLSGMLFSSCVFHVSNSQLTDIDWGFNGDSMGIGSVFTAMRILDQINEMQILPLRSRPCAPAGSPDSSAGIGSSLEKTGD